MFPHDVITQCYNEGMFCLSWGEGIIKYIGWKNICKLRLIPRGFLVICVYVGENFRVVETITFSVTEWKLQMTSF